MHRCYRRPGMARPIDDIFPCRSERQIPARISARARRERLSKLITKLISRHDPDDFEESMEDRRNALRQSAEEHPFDAVTEDHEFQTIWLEDVSRSGIRFRSLTTIACGTPLTIRPPLSHRLSSIKVRIVRAQMVDPLMADRGYEYGAEYLDPGDHPHEWYLATRARR